MKNVSVILKHLILTFAIISTPFILTSQDNNKLNAGSAKQLTGNILSVVCFISTPDNNWSNQERNLIISDIREAEEWIVGQSDNYNMDITMDHIVLNPDNDLIFDTIEPGLASGKERVDWVYRVIKKTGYKNSKKASKKLKRKYNADNLQVLIMAKGNGRPYAMRFADGNNKKKYYLEGALIYSNYLNESPVPVTSATAHEIMHIYGAWDLYYTFEQSKERQEKAKKMYPNDIMLRIDHHITPLEINELTAWLIGWNKNYKEEFEWFRPSGCKK